MSENFEQLLEESFKNSVMQTGAVIVAEVVDLNSDYIIVNAGLKSESEIPATQFATRMVQFLSKLEIKSKLQSKLWRMVLEIHACPAREREG